MCGGTEADGIVDLPVRTVPPLNPDQISAAAAALAKAERPLIVVGGGGV